MPLAQYGLDVCMLTPVIGENEKVPLLGALLQATWVWKRVVLSTGPWESFRLSDITVVRGGESCEKEMILEILSA